MATQAYGQLGRGLGTAIGSFFGDNSQQRQAGEMAGLRSIALQDQIDLTRAKAKEAQNKADLITPEATIGRVLTGLGVPTDQTTDVSEFLRSGRHAASEPVDMGPVAPKPSWMGQDLRTEIGKRLSGLQSIQAGEGKDLKDVAESQGIGLMNTAIAQALAGGDVVKLAQLQNKDPMKQVQSLIASGIQSGTLDPALGGRRMAASEAKPLFNADSTGAVLDLFGGGLNVANPLAGSTINLRQQQAGQARAGAAENYAQAAKARQETGDMRSGGGKAPAGYRWMAGGELEAIPGGPADTRMKKGSEPTEGERKAGSLLRRLRGSQQQLGVALEETPGAAKPGMLEESVRRIGGDTPANLLTGQARQRVEAAQLDMLDAALTLGTGAAYTKEQLKGYAKSYFPQIGDDVRTVQDKQARLQNVIEAAEIAAGRSAEKATAGFPKDSGAQPARVQNDADYAALPTGARFITPDGKTGTKK